MISILSGLAAGTIHVVSGPDHLAAVAPMAARTRHRTWRLGMEWGGGHAAGILMIGLVSLVLRDHLAAEMISSWSERLVGLVLIAIGLWGFRQVLARRVHTHEHVHGGVRHVHVHMHRPGEAHDAVGANPGAAEHRHSHTAFWVGGLHGLAGGSHFLVVIPALAFPSALQTLGFLASYGVGTVVAMILFSSMMGGMARRFSSWGARAYGTFLAGCSMMALVVGGYWLVG